MSIFTKIIRGEIPGYKIHENDRFFAFLDIHPLVKGHTLVVPKKEVDKWWDMPEEDLREAFIFARPIAAAIEKAFPCNRCGLSVVGIEVPHAHMHLVPLNTADDLNFTRKKLSLSEEEMKEVQEKILAHLQV